ncbi:MAG: bifunctional precorrin-2 dehydrogenase/sirohydrochlorin ferrochelatase [Caldilineaceae bacterium]|nr:bifunctional precorrin-2 dehydrogenase/sirohydrochlorin ferrochelatase [Caldilineaceae bacterium]
MPATNSRPALDDQSRSAVYPLFLIGLHQQLCVVVGGGPVGERKVSGLIEAQAQVRVISPTATPILQAWGEAGQIEWWPRPYQPGDLAGAFLVFAATNVRAVNGLIAQDARQAGALCNVADAPAEGNFHVPALHRQGGFVVAVGSQQGKNPKLVKQLRDKIAQFITNLDIFS